MSVCIWVVLLGQNTFLYPSVFVPVLWINWISCLLFKWRDWTLIFEVIYPVSQSSLRDRARIQSEVSLLLAQNFFFLLSNSYPILELNTSDLICFISITFVQIIKLICWGKLYLKGASIFKCNSSLSHIHTYPTPPLF